MEERSPSSRASMNGEVSQILKRERRGEEEALERDCLNEMKIGLKQLMAVVTS